jgi:hypothetical protein
MKSPTIALSLVYLLAIPALAPAADGWKMPNLNPFAKKAGPPTSARVSDSSGWSMPKLWPSTKKTTTAKRGPTMWQKMSSGTKSMLNKTADFLNPFDDAEDAPAEPKITGSNSYFSQVANRKQPEKKSSTFLPSWLSGEPEQEKPRTVQDFLRQDRPEW